jgi:hypothetical protein
MGQFYFKYLDSELCYSEKFFKDMMKNRGLKQMNVYKAEPEKINGIFWCKEFLFSGDGTKDYCGKQCKKYNPRNGKSGCCINHSNILYSHGDLVTLSY